MMSQTFVYYAIAAYQTGNKKATPTEDHWRKKSF